jgi:hypothetical protein
MEEDQAPISQAANCRNKDRVSFCSVGKTITKSDEGKTDRKFTRKQYEWKTGAIKTIN